MKMEEKFSRAEQIMKYYQKGSRCIEDAEFLFNNRKRENVSILLLHGLELLFKSFILLKDEGIKNDSLKRFGHSYLCAYNYCLKIDQDKIISNEVFRSKLQLLHDCWEEDIVTARYPDRACLKLNFPSIFEDVREYIINSMHETVFEYYDRNK